MIEQIQGLLCECDKCGHKWRSFVMPKQCTNSKCRTLLWNEEVLDLLIEDLELLKAPSTPVTTSMATRVRMLGKEFDEVEMVQTEIWLMSDKTKHLFKRGENNQLVDLGVSD